MAILVYSMCNVYHDMNLPTWIGFLNNSSRVLSAKGNYNLGLLTLKKD